jgi:3D (Asp-Asp-Asp) domain-containing protein
MINFKTYKMKKIITSAALLLVTACSIAQDNYTVKMNMKIEGLPPEYAGFGEQEMVNYVKGDKYKNEISSMMMTSVSAFDGTKLTSITEQMGNKSGFTATKEELDAADKNEKTTEAKPKIEYTADKKTIAGYECTKAVVTSIGKDKKENKMNVWVTEKIKSNQAQGKKRGGRGMMMDLGDLKGYPLEMEMSQSQQGMDMKILITATEVLTTPIDDATFTVSTEGYKMMSYKEMQDKMKAAKEEK